MRRVVRRARTRKLYDPQIHRYVTLQEVLAAAAAGEEIEVVAEGSRADMTAQTLALGLAKREETAPSVRVKAALLKLARELGNPDGV